MCTNVQLGFTTFAACNSDPRSENSSLFLQVLRPCHSVIDRKRSWSLSWGRQSSILTVSISIPSTVATVAGDSVVEIQLVRPG